MLKIKDILRLITYLCVLLSYISVVGYVNIYYSVGFIALLIFAAYSDYYERIMISRALLNFVSLLIIAVSSLRAGYEFLVEPALDALVILIAIKLLEDKKFRDYMQIYAMCMFLLMGSCLLSLRIAFLVYFILFVLLTTSSLLLLTYFSHDPDMVMQKEHIAKTLCHSLLITGIAIPAGLIFFIILPRTNYPLLSFLNKEAHGVSGFGDRVKLGEVSNIQEDNSAIFRAEMEKVDQEKLYWRGIVLDRFDEASWSSSGNQVQKPSTPEKGRTIKQTILLEPYGNRYLFALDRPLSIHLKKQAYLDKLEYSLGVPVFERMKYDAVSAVSDSRPESDIDSAHYLKLPEGFSPGIEGLVTGLAGSKGENEKIHALLSFLKWGDFHYSMVNLRVSKTPLEDFLLVSKYGNCEYFASSLAVMLRMTGVPARLIGGYKGGYYNDAGKYYLVLQKNAHVWVEAYTSTRGWIRLDPTPDAVENPATALQRSSLLQIRLIMDTFNYYWYKLVINYDFKKQLFLLSKIRSSFEKPDLSGLKIGLSKLSGRGIAAFLAVPILIALLTYRISSSRTSASQRLVAEFVKRLRRYGYERGRGEGLEELVSRIEAGDLRDRAHQLVWDFERIFYRDRAFTKEALSDLHSRVKGL